MEPGRSDEGQGATGPGSSLREAVDSLRSVAAARAGSAGKTLAEFHVIWNTPGMLDMAGRVKGDVTEITHIVPAENLVARKTLLEWAMKALSGIPVAAVDGSQVYPSDTGHAGIWLARGSASLNMHDDAARHASISILEAMAPGGDASCIEIRHAGTELTGNLIGRDGRSRCGSEIDARFRSMLEGVSLIPDPADDKAGERGEGWVDGRTLLQQMTDASRYALEMAVGSWMIGTVGEAVLLLDGPIHPSFASRYSAGAARVFPKAARLLVGGAGPALVAGYTDAPFSSVLSRRLFSVAGKSSSEQESTTDAAALASMLHDFGSRTPFFQSRIGAGTAFCYVGLSGGRVARVEVVESTAGDRTLSGKLLAVVLAEAAAGRGYPLCLMKAHELAVIGGGERMAFERLILEASESPSVDGEIVSEPDATGNSRARGRKAEFKESRF